MTDQSDYPSIRAGIMGVTGYTGFELYQLLRRHPQVTVSWLTTESHGGQRLSDVFPCPWDDPLISLAEAPLADVDVVFLCLPHAASMPAVAAVRQAGTRAIDLSADFRLHDPAIYQHWYSTPHTEPELLAQAVYGLPELHRKAISGAMLVANPGCYPTSVILGLWPLARAGWLTGQVIVDSKSGVSGAGRKPKLTTSFVEANENLSPYSIGRSHRHLAEMEQELSAAGSSMGGSPQLVFSPHLLPVSRGILSTMYVVLPPGVDETSVRAAYATAYAAEPFIHLLPPGHVATLQHTVGSNRCAIGMTFVPGSPLVIITSTIDNLIKGASGQAVQNMNVMFGLAETMGFA
jgi:N-acetyl-gamma-glutamyl-phosphate reductase